MSFEAGSITGKLGLDTHDLLQAEGIMRMFPEVVTEFMANPLLGLADVAKESLDFVKDSIRETIDEAAQMGFDSDKLGVNVQWLSQWSAVAKTVNIDQQQLTNGMFMLTRQVGDALQGSKEAQKGFSELGITMDWLRQHSGDTAAIFDEVSKKLSEMPDATHRAAAAQEVLGRGAKDLAPMFALTADQIQHVMDMQRKLGDVTDEEEARQAKDAKMLEAEWDMAAQGIKKSIGKGFLEEIDKRLPEIEQEMTGSADSARDFGKALGDVAADSIPLLIAGLHALDSLLKEVDGALKELPDMKWGDVAHLSIGGLPKWMGGQGMDHIGDHEQTMHHNDGPADPDRAKKEALIRSVLGGNPSADWTDAEIEKLYQAALARQGGAAASTPPAAASSSSSDASWQEENSIMSRITSGKEYGSQLQADMDRYHALTSADFARAQAASSSSAAMGGKTAEQVANDVAAQVKAFGEKLFGVDPASTSATAQPTGQSSANIHVNLNLTIDSSKTADEITRQLKPHIEDAMKEAHRTARKVAHNLQRTAQDYSNVESSMGGLP